jgi:hypothetical protein
MKKINFTNTSAQKIYADYLNRVKRTISILAPADQLEIMMEINSHIYEATQGAQAENEIEILVDTLENLGAPEDVLQPLVANKKVLQATRSFRPGHIIQALYLNVNNGVGFIIFTIIYLLIIALGALIPLKLIFPNRTGLFIRNDHFFGFGYVTELKPGLTELLGNWFIITVILLIVVFYFFNTLLFRLLRKK